MEKLDSISCISQEEDYDHWEIWSLLAQRKIKDQTQEAS